MKFASLVGHRVVHGGIGLEIETEAKAGYDNPVQDFAMFWNAHNDGSLRNVGVEYVFNTPYNFRGPEYTKALELFDKLTKVVKFTPSTYTSVHVHLNMTTETIMTIANFITTYFIVEELLNEYCGPDRDGNLFCLKTSVSEGIFVAAKDLLKSFDTGSESAKINMTKLSQNNLKYGALNLYALRQFGSLEIRTHPGTVDVKLIDRWVSILVDILNYSRHAGTPVDIVNSIYANGNQAFVTEVFEGNVKYFNLTGIEDRLADGIWYATSIANSCSANWKNYGNNPWLQEERPKKPKAVPFEGMTQDEITAFFNLTNANPITTEVDV